jgi:hypothetical protein
MIGVRLMGGLGNQMFQYAAALRLAKHHNTSAVMDLAFFENIAEVDTPREYELDCFQLKPEFLAPAKRPADDSSIYGSRRGKLLYYMHRLAGNNWSVYREPHHNFEPSVLDLPDRSYLIGYWQTEQYFMDIRATLLNEFAFKTKPAGHNQELLERITSTRSVSLHVRRGDYVSNKHAKKFHGTKDQAYYNAALRPILLRVKQPTLFVFSDDTTWCEQNLKFEQPTVFVTGNRYGFEDMRLMQHCQHNVIANSSFSWWAAWLNQNPEKIVVAPQQWFTDPAINTSDVIPKTWVKV